ncbi:equilibrative nucleoside transporter 1-like isoform X2 [Seriola lalandi dorsalis]|uniref:equilibrative nucleoside transporter 1-like isoform X2 n=1 Tax=Seriola lalandi dorsalis TaxID=1841481 RepID=UPI000C6FB7C4|nr:equilibrative nucleoside transporter 1-like isoform X2 [Seriola lalandi dorsalis]
MAVSSPKDKYLCVWLIFFLLGLGTLLPWNFFMNATMYFTSRLKDSSSVNSSANQTEAEGEHRSVLEAKFNNVMTLCAMLPLLLCTCLNSFLHTLISQHLRVMGSLLIIMFIFTITAVLVKVPLEPLPFFSITMVKIVIINSFGAVLQGSLFGMAGLLPTSYTTPIMSGQGLAGTFAAFAMICAIADLNFMMQRSVISSRLVLSFFCPSFPTSSFPNWSFSSFIRTKTGSRDQTRRTQ